MVISLDFYISFKFQIKSLLVKMLITQDSALFLITIMENPSVIRWDSSNSFTFQKSFSSIKVPNTGYPVLELFMHISILPTRL